MTGSMLADKLVAGSMLPHYMPQLQYIILLRTIRISEYHTFACMSIYKVGSASLLKDMDFIQRHIFNYEVQFGPVSQ